MTDTWQFRPAGRSRRDLAADRFNAHWLAAHAKWQSGPREREEQQRKQQEHARQEQEQEQERARSQQRARQEQPRQQQQQQRSTSGGGKAGSSGSSSSGIKYDPLPPLDPSDYYAALGLSGMGKRATAAVISGAFRRELMKYHPDHGGRVEPGMPRYSPEALSERTRIILAAYGVLRDERKRAEYDSRWRR